MDRTSTLQSIRMVALVGLLMLQACGIAAKDARTGVGVHSINYSGSYYRYLVIDPDNPKNSAGGEEIHPYAAGGLMCCYALPDQWRPGLKAKVRFRVSVMRDGQWEEDLKEELVEVPAYAKGDPPELWVVRAEDGSASVVLSNANPSHPDWPGKVKGWPVPAIEYRRQLWDQQIQHEEGNLSLYSDLLKKLNEYPDTALKEAWEWRDESAKRDRPGRPSSAIAHMAREDAELLKRFQGPKDPAFANWLKDEYQKNIIKWKNIINELRNRRP